MTGEARRSCARRRDVIFQSGCGHVGLLKPGDRNVSEDVNRSQSNVEEYEMLELIIEILIGAAATAFVAYVVDAARTRLRLS